jgi:hypothetical protein
LAAIHEHLTLTETVTSLICKGASMDFSGVIEPSSIAMCHLLRSDALSGNRERRTEAVRLFRERGSGIGEECRCNSASTTTTRNSKETIS